MTGACHCEALAVAISMTTERKSRLLHCVRNDEKTCNDGEFHSDEILSLRGTE